MSVLLEAVQSAGDAILKIQKKGITVKKKSNQDIVTEADVLANDLLKKHLLSAFPDTGWLSEETVDDFTRLNCDQVWIVDPIDGTREFAENIPEFAVSVALVEKGEPILASVYNPASEELFYAIKDEGVWLNDKKIKPKEPDQTENLIFLASRSEYRRGEWQAFEKIATVKPTGSIAYKLALIATGAAHATFSLGPKSEWDVAAGVLLVLESGGTVTNKHKETLRFNNKSVLIDGIVATVPNISERVWGIVFDNHIISPPLF